MQSSLPKKEAAVILSNLMARIEMCSKMSSTSSSLKAFAASIVYSINVERMKYAGGRILRLMPNSCEQANTMRCIVAKHSEARSLVPSTVGSQHDEA